MLRTSVLALAATTLLAPAAAVGGDAAVVDARAMRAGDSWRFDVTVRHPDNGWDHYADKWEVLATDGTTLGTRVLLHPHEHEQPFTRSLSGVEIPDDVAEVVIRAHDNVDGYGDTTFILPLPR